MKRVDGGQESLTQDSAWLACYRSEVDTPAANPTICSRERVSDARHPAPARRAEKHHDRKAITAGYAGKQAPLRATPQATSTPPRKPCCNRPKIKASYESRLRGNEAAAPLKRANDRPCRSRRENNRSRDAMAWLAAQADKQPLNRLGICFAAAALTSCTARRRLGLGSLPRLIRRPVDVRGWELDRWRRSSRIARHEARSR